MNDKGMVPAAEYNKLKQELEYVSTSLQSIAAKLEIDLHLDNPEWPEAVEGYFNDWFNQASKRLEELHALTEKYKAEVASTKASEIRWANRMRLLENRIRFALEIFDGMEVPTINELRKARGLDPLPQLGGEYKQEELKL